jgi:hypothetical protein
MVNKYSQPSNIAGRNMATIYAIAHDNANIEIRLKEFWNDGHQAYIVLTNEQAKELANDIYQIIKDGE